MFDLVGLSERQRLRPLSSPLCAAKLAGSGLSTRCEEATAHTRELSIFLPSARLVTQHTG